jgi:branched-chain amino acid transport system substrate-binding protein
MERNKKSLWIVSVIVVVILVIVGLASMKKPLETGPIKIGFVAPLTGDAGGIGQNMKIAAELAVSEINSAGGINGRMITLVAEDGKCDGKEAVTAVTKLINIDKVGMIVGGACSSETVSTAPIAEKARVVMLSPLSSNPSITNAGDYIFRNYASDSFQGVKAAEFAVNTLKSKNIAVLSCMSDWCQGLQQEFKNKAVSLGAKIAIEEKYDDKNTNDLKTQLTKIKAINPDLVYFVGYTDGTIIGLKQAKELGLQVQMLGGDAWNDPKIVAGAGSAAEGTMYLVPTSAKASAFEGEMAKVTNGKEITVGSRESYDAVKILAQVMTKVGSDSTKVKDALYKVTNYQGVSGNISFDKNGDLVSASYDIKIVKEGKSVNY